MTTCCGVLGQRIPRAEEPGRLQSMGLKQSDTTEVTSVLILIDKPYLLVVDLRSVCGYRILSLSSLAVFFTHYFFLEESGLSYEYV